MTASQLKEAHGVRPFKPFALRLADGQSVPVRHPEMMYITPGGKTAFVMVDDDAAKIIDMVMIVSIDLSNGVVPTKRESTSG